jgi:AraC family transcriptional regulator of adaptative response/methylated-DNA-[protein]-cysteine methyltransferase
MTDYERIEKVICYLGKHRKEQPSLAKMAKAAGLSEFHFHRLFRRWAGTSPKAFLAFLTARHAKSLLRQQRSVLHTALEVGLSGPGRLHDLMVRTEGMSPGEVKRKGKGMLILYGIHPSPFGPCLIGLTKRGICHLAFLEGAGEQAIQSLKQSWPSAHFQENCAETAAMIQRIFQRKPSAPIPLLLKGSAFQLKVWEALLHTHRGELVSYSDLSRKIGTKSSRAVGSAVARNNLAFLIPCHRVIRKTGEIGQYRWGQERKQAILAWEHTNPASQG